jgi:hypothetical protein
MVVDEVFNELGLSLNSLVFDHRPYRLIRGKAVDTTEAVLS